MPRTRRIRFRTAMVVLTAILGCVDERVVFRDRELFTEPPPGSANFIGYTDQSSKLPVCGNCHVGHQADWVNTAHADAWATLAASPGRQASCEGCHTVSSRGNAASGQVAWDATKDTRYHDVQCESCHGAGLEHVRTPDRALPPLASLAVDTGTAIARGCGECHSGTHHPYVEEWKQSGHGNVQASPAGRAECNVCHTAEDVLAAWGIRVNYAERDTVAMTAGRHLPITCGVCHDPHARDIPGQLRFPVDVPTEEQNLCMKCHHKRGNPDPTTFRGPHSPEGPVLLGYGGWWPPALQFAGDTIRSTHGSSQNPKLCAGCHLPRFTVTDAQGGFQFQATGHLFEAIPCINAQGLPTRGDCGLGQRTFKVCTEGCHVHTEASARSAYITVELRISTLSETVERMLDQVPASEFNTSDNRYTTGEGTRFNLELAGTAGSFVHNPFLIEALLTASIVQLRKDYGIPAPPGIPLENTLSRGGS
ncbi:MAG: hypothetical protein L0271_23290 [Gemmatimonadetes bacterium]|nr:hypothetical protein [Gemmatimonadota bacterium]